jgi:signal transduction histidine kinase
VSLNELLAAVVDSVSLSVDDAGQVLEIEAGSSVSVLADRSLLRQALVNVVDNAIKYGPRGQRIRVEVATEDGRARVSVVDQGPGIPAADRGVVLEPYRRLARDESSERTGSGLGLAVARQIVEACDGTISITEASPTGTRVTIALRTA